MSLSIAGRENIKTVGGKNVSITFVGDHWEKYWGFVEMELKRRIGNWAGNGGILKFGVENTKNGIEQTLILTLGYNYAFTCNVKEKVILLGKT